ncbi:MAG: amylo-alpha-1,6-glucosidase [bacterium]
MVSRRSLWVSMFLPCWLALITPTVRSVTATEPPALPPGIPAAPSLEELTITVTADFPREFIFTDKRAAHLAGEAVGADTRSYHGFYIAMHEFLDGWSLRLEDGVVVGPATADSARVRPDRLVRYHTLPDGQMVTETVTLFDRENGFQVTFDGVPSGRFELLPRVDMRFLWQVGKPRYEVRWQDGVLLVNRPDRPASTPADLPGWLALTVSGAEGFEPDGQYLDTTYPKGVARRAMANASPYLPGALWGRIPPRLPSGRLEFVCAADTDAASAALRVHRLRSETSTLTADRQHRLEELLAATHLSSGIPGDDRALAWTRISLDNLIMAQRGVGIYAGFYWFTTYWGRDTFITLPGACLTSGDFETAETILRSFAAYQDRDPASEREGRLPNFVTVEQVQFAGVDGTWWFVRALDELWRRSGHGWFAREMAPVVFRAVAGALRHAVDEHGYLQHGDGETWMDAGGEANPYSPRGDRAVEVQALFHRGLLTAARLAEHFPDLAGNAEGLCGEELAAAYRQHAERLATSFERDFWRDGHLSDHLDVNGAADAQIRPNGLLALLASPTLFTATQRQLVTDLNAAELVKPWGVVSLDPADPFFHPRHLDLGKYYYDEAYHNGDLWLWLSGPFVSALPDAADGFGQTRMLLDEVLEEGAVGTLQEIRDGARAESNDEFGGATSQAWSLSELLRNVVDDYLGLEVDLTASPPRVAVDCRLPADWPRLIVHTQVGEYDCFFHCQSLNATVGRPTCEIWFDQPPPADWIISLGADGVVWEENINSERQRVEDSEAVWHRFTTGD